ncbi:MAG: hypothetical protein KDH18_25805 [Rhodoferax sp.]|nr:hypothetical protein [Rhodoferax sp.]
MNGTALWIALLSAILGGVMAALQFALAHLSKSKMRRVLAAKKKPIDMESILDDPDDYALAMSIPRLVFNLTTVAAAVVWAGGIVSDAGVIRWAWVAAAVGMAAAAVHRRRRSRSPTTAAAGVPMTC